MKRFLQSIFQHRCPACGETLLAHRDSLRLEKACPHGHYKEEAYSHLGVVIVYEDIK